METWSETINSYVRPFVMLAFSMAFIVGFFMKLIGAEAFLAAFGVIQAWFFKSRDEVQPKKQ